MLFRSLMSWIGVTTGRGPVYFASLAAVLLLMSACGGNDSTESAPPKPMAEQSACQSLVPASQGGPMPEADTMVIRWLGTSNFEVAFHDRVIVMDTYYNRPARTRSVGKACRSTNGRILGASSRATVFAAPSRLAICARSVAASRG